MCNLRLQWEICQWSIAVIQYKQYIAQNKQYLLTNGYCVAETLKTFYLIIDLKYTINIHLVNTTIYMCSFFHFLL